MKDIILLENQIVEYCTEHMEKADFIGIKHIKLQNYDESNRKATFIADDISSAVFVQIRCSQKLVQALESIVGEPAYVDCQYRTYSKPVHERFTRTKLN